MKTFFGYIRVSTAKQGEKGVSLQEQRDAIQRYAQRNSLEIASWFEERETAAKRGRPVFSRMLKLIRQGKADGVLIHKIDRSARNLKDWADLGELIDQGIDVHFANESLDLHSRGGRLSADIQAVVAADYIRNLREETRKGFYGRIKQGLYPLPAPLGYVDKGKGKPKEIDPVAAPLVKRAFELYATGKYNLNELVEEMFSLGLRSKRGKKVPLSSLSIVLNNPFYMGLIRLKRTGETYPGSHQPLIPKSLFDRVHGVLTGKINARIIRHDFLFRRMLVCKQCGYSLTGERQKGHIYYRCHTKGCPTTSVREEAVEESVLNTLSPLRLSEEEKVYLQSQIALLTEKWAVQQEAAVKSLTLRLSQLQDRLTRLTDAYIDQAIERQLFEERKTALLLEQKAIEEQVLHLKSSDRFAQEQLTQFFERAETAYSTYSMENAEEKRDLLRIVTSNRQIDGKRIELTLKFPFTEVADRLKSLNGSPYQERLRTLDRLLETLVVFFRTTITDVVSS